MDSRSFLHKLDADVSVEYAIAFYLGLIGETCHAMDSDSVEGYYDGQKLREYIFALEQNAYRRRDAQNDL
jgi:hypothetical protein